MLILSRKETQTIRKVQSKNNRGKQRSNYNNNNNTISTSLRYQSKIKILYMVRMVMLAISKVKSTAYTTRLSLIKNYLLIMAIVSCDATFEKGL